MIKEAFIILVEALPGHWKRIGPVYRKRDTARSWLSFVRSAWHGAPTRIKRLPVTVQDGKPTEKCVQLFDRYGIDIN